MPAGRRPARSKWQCSVRPGSRNATGAAPRVYAIGGRLWATSAASSACACAVGCSGSKNRTWFCAALTPPAICTAEARSMLLSEARVSTDCVAAGPRAISWGGTPRSGTFSTTRFCAPCAASPLDHRYLVPDRRCHFRLLVGGRERAVVGDVEHVVRADPYGVPGAAPHANRRLDLGRNDGRGQRIKAGSRDICPPPRQTPWCSARARCARSSVPSPTSPAAARRGTVRLPRP